MSDLPTHPLLHALATAGEDDIPSEAIAQCMLCIPEVAPELLAAIARAADGPVTSQAELNLVFYGHYILGAAREPRLLAPLLRLLRLPDDTLDAVIGSEYVSTLASVAVGAFDGDAEALFDLLTDADASAYVRMVMFGALAYLTWADQIPADTTRAFLYRFDTERRTPAGDMGWNGWETAIELLGWQAFVPLVQAAYDDGRLDTGMSEMRLFLQGVAEAANAAPDDDKRFKHESYCYIKDVLAIIEFPAPLLGGSRDVAFSDGAALDGLVNSDSTGNADRLGWAAGAYEPRRNPLRHVGRNDPCPCGSGKKYKKCCLAA